MPSGCWNTWRCIPARPSRTSPSRLKLTAEDTLRLLTELEARGAVQLSGDQGSGHVRIAAITKAGREQVA